MTVPKNLPYGIPTLNLTRSQSSDPKELFRALQNFTNDLTGYLQRISASINLKSRGAFTSATLYDYFQPGAGGSVVATQLSRMLLDPAGDIAAVTITLPKGTVDGQEWRVASTKNITTATLQAVAGQVTATTKISLGGLAGGQSFFFRKTNSTWYPG